MIPRCKLPCGITQPIYFDLIDISVHMCTLDSFVDGRKNRLAFFQFNFVGKLLGPKGNSMKRLQEDTMTKMAVLGRGSMRNKQQVRI